MFTIEEVIYDINGLKSSHKKFTIARLFTIDRFTIARFDCICLHGYVKYNARHLRFYAYSNLLGCTRFAGAS